MSVSLSLFISGMAAVVFKLITLGLGLPCPAILRVPLIKTLLKNHKNTIKLKGIVHNFFIFGQISYFE